MLDWVPRWLRWVFSAVVLGLVVWFLVVPQFSEAETALDAVAGIGVVFVVASVVLVAGAIASQAQLTRSVVPEGERPALGTMLRFELATTAVSHTVPGGTAAGTALAYRLLTNAGVGGASTGFALAIRGIGGALVLNGLLWLALVISIPAHGFSTRYTIAAGLGVVLFGAAGAFVVALLRAEQRVTDLLCGILRPVPFVNHDGVPGVVGKLADQLRSLVSDRRLAIRAIGWAAAYWLLNAGALWVLLDAFGDPPDPISVMVAFGLVNVLAAIPVTPRGLGVLEAVLIPMLVGFGAASDQATLSVIGYRLLSFWAPIPLGTLSYVSVRITDPQVRPEEARRELGRTAKEDRESWRDWAARHGLEPRRGR